MRHRRWIVAGSAALAALVGVPAQAAPTTPAPTFTKKFYAFNSKNLTGATDACDPNVPERFDQALLDVKWSEAKRGRDATLSVTGTPMAPMSGCVEAIWTSVPLTVLRRGPLARVAVEWSALQADPYDAGGDQIISFRFADARGRWGIWTNAFSDDTSYPLDPNTVHRAAFGVPYRGVVPARNIRVQVRIQDKFYVMVATMRQTVRITA